MDSSLSASYPTRRNFLWMLLAAAGYTTGRAYSQTKSPWQTTKIEGRQYAAISSLKNFYRFASIKQKGNSVLLENRKTIVKFTIGGNECLMNNVKFILSNSVESLDGKAYVSHIDLVKLIDPVLRPMFIRNAGDFRTVILDPGHGGNDPGATNSLGTEAKYNLKVAGLAKGLLQSKGYKVVMSRSNDRFISLQERVNLANAIRENAIFISIHFNSGRSQARGIETFTLSPPGVSHYGSAWKPSDEAARIGNHQDSANIALATALHGSVLRRLGKNTFDRGIKRARFSVLSGVRHPAILFEGGFMTHPREARLIDNADYQKAVANGILDAVLRYRSAVSPQNKPK